MASDDRIDALICAIHMLVGQMQAEKEVEYRWQLWRDYTTTHFHVEDDEEDNRLREDALAADRRAAGMRATETPRNAMPTTAGLVLDGVDLGEGATR